MAGGQVPVPAIALLIVWLHSRWYQASNELQFVFFVGLGSLLLAAWVQEDYHAASER